MRLLVNGAASDVAARAQETVLTTLRERLDPAGAAYVFITLTTIALAACSSGSEPGVPKATSGSVTVVVDNLAGGRVAGVHYQGPDGVDHYIQAQPGPNVLVSGAAFGTYRLQLDTVWFDDSGLSTGSFKYDGSRWVGDPISASVAIDASKPDDTLHVAFRQMTGGITVVATDPMPDGFWVELLNSDGTDCHCIPGGHGIRAVDSVTVQNLLPGIWRAHFLPMTHFTSPHQPPETIYTVVPSPDTVKVTVSAKQIARASAVYRLQ